MNHDLNDAQLETLLRGLAPAAVPPALTHRVDAELQLDLDWLGTSHRPRRTVRWLTAISWAAMGAAAAVAVMSAIPPQPRTPTFTVNTPPAVLPVSTIREWEDIQNDGIHYSAERLPEQHVTLFARERQTWIDPRDGAEMTVEYPREQKLVLPVSFQ